MAFSKFKGGLLPKKVRPEVPCLGDFLPAASQWPQVKPRGWEYVVPNGMIGMLGNDTVGDCVIAAMYHAAQVESWNSGAPLLGTTDLCLSTYSAITGYNPADPSTDQGTAWSDALSYWKSNGIPILTRDGVKTNHRILGWASLDISSIAQMRYANDIFGGVVLAIQCPQSAEADTSNWTYQSGSPIAGGHGINMAGQGGAGGHIQSWGMNIPFTWEFMLNYLVEAYCVVSESWLSANGESPSGLNLTDLLKAMQGI